MMGANFERAEKMTQNPSPNVSYKMMFRAWGAK